MWIDRGTYWLSTTPQNTPEWLNERKGLITGSICYEICHKSRFRDVSKETIAKEIKGEIVREFDDDTKFRMEKGHEYEPIAREYMCNKLKLNISEMGFSKWKENDYIGASLDGECDSIGIEIKCPRYCYNNIIYDNHYYQIIHNGIVANKKKMIYCVYGWEDKKVKMKMYDVDKTFWEKNILYKEIEFINEFLKNY